MTVEKQEIERFAKKRGWSKERVNSLYEQSQNVVRRGKGILGDREDISARTTVEGLNAVGEVLVLSTGDIDYNGHKITVDEYVLQALKEDSKRRPIEAYVGHQTIHKNKVGQFTDMQIKQCVHDPEKVGLYASLSMPDNDLLDKDLQKDVINNIKNGKINKLSPAFKLTYTTLGDGNKYPTMAKFDEISFIPDIGVELRDASGKQSVNNMEPYTDAHIVEFFFGENQFDMYEKENTHEVVVNLSGSTYLFKNADVFLPLLSTDILSIDIEKTDIHAADMLGFDKRISIKAHKLNDIEHEICIGDKTLYVSELDGKMMFNAIPERVKKIKMEIEGLSDKEKSFFIHKT